MMAMIAMMAAAEGIPAVLLPLAGMYLGYVPAIGGSQVPPMDRWDWKARDVLEQLESEGLLNQAPSCLADMRWQVATALYFQDTPSKCIQTK